MRDRGLDEAIRAAGGVSELARRIGISQPSVSNWERVPAERVGAVEAATGIGRACCARTFSTKRRRLPSIRSIALARPSTRCWPRSFRETPDADLLKRLSRFAGDQTRLGVAHTELAAAAARTNAEAV